MPSINPPSMKNTQPPSIFRTDSILYTPIVRFSVASWHSAAASVNAPSLSAKATRDGTDSITSPSVATTNTGAAALQRHARYLNHPISVATNHTAPSINKAHPASAKYTKSTTGGMNDQRTTPQASATSTAVIPVSQSHHCGRALSVIFTLLHTLCDKVVDVIARRILAHLTVLLGAFAAVWAMTVTTPRTFAYVAGGDRIDVLLDSAATAATISSVVSAVVATTCTGKRTAYVAAGFGIFLLAAVSLFAFTGQLHIRAIAAGLILGGCAALIGSRDRRTLQSALIVGAIAGIVLVRPIEASRTRYRDYITDDMPQTYLLIALVVFAILLVASQIGNSSDPVEASVSVEGRSRVLLVAIAVPIAGLVLYWMFERSVDSLGAGGAMQDRWLTGLVVIPLLVGAAFVLPGLTGTVVLAALAFLASMTAGSLGLPTALLFVALIVVGALVGWRRPSPLIALGVLAVVAATGVFAESSLEDVQLAANTLVLPVAVGVLYASLLPTSAPAAVIAVTTPICVSVPIVAEYGWTAYTPLTSIEPTFSPSTWVWTSTAVGVGSVLAAGAALMVLRARRSGSDSSSSART